MKKTILPVLLLAAPAALAGTPSPAVAPPPSQGDWITPLIDIRIRYEFADIDRLDVSHALTFRERLGFKTAAWQGFSALVEGEFSQAAIDDFHGGAPLADPTDPRNSPIFDPETNELNQAYLQYQGFDTTIRLGRQRIVYDAAAFIGDVIWRQNQQTYDAISLTNTSIPGLTVNYAYLNQVNRIFGSDADAPLTPGFANVQDIAASAHLFNANYTGIQGVTLGAYAYIMNFEAVRAWDNNTFGIHAKTDLAGFTLYGELAWQDKAGLAGAEEAMYLHANVTRELALGSAKLGALTVGVEHLDAGFKTPLATVHAFNGFADVTDPARISGAHNGLTDTYVSHALPIFWGMKWVNVIHILGDNEISAGYGWEYDSVLVKKFNDHFTAIAKFAWFNSEGDGFIGAAPLPDATRFSVEMNYLF